MSTRPCGQRSPKLAGTAMPSGLFSTRSPSPWRYSRTSSRVARRRIDLAGAVDHRPQALEVLEIEPLEDDAEPRRPAVPARVTPHDAGQRVHGVAVSDRERGRGLVDEEGDLAAAAGLEVDVIVERGLEERAADGDVAHHHAL